MNETIGTFRIVETLGQGGMGTVYRAVDTMLERTVALKVVRAEFAGESDLADRFRAEALILAKLKHPNITALHGLVREGNQLLMVMEFVEGETLEHLLRREVRVDADRAADWCRQVLEALAYAHGRNVIHRDIKPANLMVDAENVVHVMDFGIARVVGSTRLTQVGYSVGTASHMAPEQIRGQAGDARTDIYALGIVLYELLTGAAPFRGSTEFVVTAHLTQQPVPPRQVVPDLPLWVDGVVMRALEKSASDRFQTADEFRRALESTVYRRVVRSELAPDLVDEATTRLAPDAPAANPPAAPPAAEGMPAPPPRSASPDETIRGGSHGMPPVIRFLLISAVLLALYVAAGITMALLPESWGLKSSFLTDALVQRLPATPAEKTAAERMEFVRIGPGSFEMGSDEPELRDSQPMHPVAITHAFEMGKYEVTQAQWHGVMGSNPSRFPKYGLAYPVENVSWTDVQVFLSKLNARHDGYRYRLPTEAEWEYAARAGTAGNAASDLNEMGWFSGHSMGATNPVGRKRSNAWGLHDMLGNVSEWVSDWYGAYPPPGGVVDPTGPSSGEFRVFRGGSYSDEADSLNSRVAFRYRAKPVERGELLGFRLVRVRVPS